MIEALRYLNFMEFVDDVIKTPVNDLSNAPLTISTKEFLDNLYVESPIEKKIIQEIKYSPENPICIVGPRGSGKSSVGLKVRDELGAPDENAFICTVDISPIKGEKFFDSRSSGDGRFREYIREKIIEHYDSALFKDIDLKYKFYEYALTRNLTEKERPESYFRMFDDLVTGLQESFQGATLDSNWLKQYASNEKVRKFIETVKSKLDLKHYAAALRYLKDYKIQIIWIDNIDSLSEKDELEMTTAIREMVRTTNGIIRFVVAVREENVTQTEHPRETFAEIFQSVIFWGDPDNPEAKNDAWFVPVAKEDRLKEIYFKRLDFARVKAPSMPSDMAETLDTDEFETLKNLARQVIAAFEVEKGIYVANNSLRDTLSILTGFLIYLLKKGLGQDRRPLASGFKLWFLQTELLFWLSRHAEGAIGYKFFNILEHSKGFLKNPQQEGHTYFLPYMVLTTVWNLCLENDLPEKAHFKLPSVSDVYRRVAIIGFKDEEKVRDTLFDLCRSPNGMNNFIAIQVSGELDKAEKIKPDHRLRLTYRGQVTLNSVCNSYGYIFGLIDDNKSLNHLDEYLEQDAKSVLKALVTIAQSHLTFVLLVRDKWFPNLGDWFSDYCRYYGTPISPPFSRIKEMKEQGFESVGQQHYALFLQLLFSSIRYYRSFQYASVNVSLKKIEQTYFDTLKEIKKGERIAPGDIKEKFRDLP